MLNSGGLFSRRVCLLAVIGVFVYWAGIPTGHREKYRAFQESVRSEFLKLL